MEIKKIPPLASKQLEPLLISISDIRPHPDNYKTHPPEQIKSLRASLKAFGVTSPLKANLEGYIVAGHGMYQLYVEDGYTHVPVIYEALDKQLSKAYLVADNETARRGISEQDKLNELLQGINDIPDFDIEAVGFSEEDIDTLLKSGEPVEVVEDEFNSDDVGEGRCKEGDLWALGSHRLLCGDSTKKDDVERLMNGEIADFCFTSPPYSDMRDYGGGDLSVENISKFIKSEFCDFWAVNLGIQRKDGKINQYWDVYINQAENEGLDLTSWNVWSKRQMGGSIANMSAMFPIEHEFIFIFGGNKERVNRTRKNKTSGTHTGISNRQKDGTTKKVEPKIVKEYGRIGTVLECCYATGKKEHPAVFPIELPSEYIKACSDEDAIIYEPFCGSGTTLIACEQLNRKCFAMELDPHYCDVIIQRWEQFTGQTAQRIN